MRGKREINFAELQHKRYLTNREAQAYLNKSHTTMWRLVKSGEIAYSRTGLSLLFDRNDLDEYVRRNRIPAIAE
ncbi:MAG: helix-turn-helix domain-containing protein [Pyrinomonadaceae bacterium]